MAKTITELPKKNQNVVKSSLRKYFDGQVWALTKEDFGGATIEQIAWRARSQFANLKKNGAIGKLHIIINYPEQVIYLQVKQDG